MKKCECSHPSSFHPAVVEEKKSDLQEIAAHLRKRLVDNSEAKRACMGEIDKRPCPCQGFVEDV